MWLGFILQEKAQHSTLFRFQCVKTKMDGNLPSTTPECEGFLECLCQVKSCLCVQLDCDLDVCLDVVFLL